jgi:hypothetical protein
VPGLNVAQINGTTWAIGARGFQSEYAAKLLVMMSSLNTDETGCKCPATWIAPALPIWKFRQKCWKSPAQSLKTAS